MTADQTFISKLPAIQASLVEEHGWAGVAQALSSEGQVVIMDGDEPEAVVLSVAEYVRLTNAAPPEGAAIDPLQTLRERFDAQLACLKEAGTAEILLAIMDKPCELNGQVIVGEGY